MPIACNPCAERLHLGGWDSYKPRCLSLVESCEQGSGASAFFLSFFLYFRRDRGHVVIAVVRVCDMDPPSSQGPVTFY